MIWGYTRISTREQDAARQKADILEAAQKAGVLVGDFVQEEVSSRRKDRKILDLIERTREGDVIITTELSRIGRSVREVQGFITTLAAKKVTVWTTANNMRLGANMDVAGEAMLFALTISAQLERDLLSERTKSGLRAARASGKKLGRPAGVSKLDAKAEEIARLQALGVTKANIAKIVGCSRAVLHNWITRRG